MYENGCSGACGGYSTTSDDGGSTDSSGDGDGPTPSDVLDDWLSDPGGAAQDTVDSVQDTVGSVSGDLGGGDDSGGGLTLPPIGALASAIGVPTSLGELLESDGAHTVVLGALASVLGAVLLSKWGDD